MTNAERAGFAFVALLALFPVTCVAAEAPDCATETVATEAGMVCGIAALDGRVRAFLGIPYAESTKGEKRWTPPIPKRPWPEVRRATEFGPACPQTVASPVPTAPHKVPAAPKATPAESEDCLSLNLWVPKDTAADAGLAVMVFIHGGAFEAGASSDPLYDGAALAARVNVVVVSFNYRLGALGFLAMDGLDGNYGFLDQQLALSWVKQNIRAFGGDPAKVTIFGESAGAMSVGLHLFSAPGSVPLFRAAIVESDFLTLPYRSLADNIGVANLFEQGLGCRDIECLRRLDVNSLLVAQQGFLPEMRKVFSGEKFHLAFTPVLDGKVLTRQPMDIEAERTATKPFILGTTHDETIPFYEGEALPPMDYAAEMAALFGRRFETVIARFPPTAGPDNWQVFSRAMTEHMLVCSTRRLAAAAESPVYVYLFDHQPSFPVWGGEACWTEGRVCHGAELPFVFESAAGIGGHFTAAESRLSAAMMDYWANFAKTLDPDGPGMPHWPRFSNKGRDYLVFDTPITTRVDPFREACVFWDRIGYELTEPWK